MFFKFDALILYSISQDMLQIYPLKFEPILFSVLWGGTKIKHLKGIEIDSDCIGESWELSAVPGSVSVISNGVYKGLTIQELLEQFGEEVVGSKVFEEFGTTFPLLIKFIDAAKDLSIQVHPNDVVAQERHRCLGKTELWYILEAQEKSSLYSGFSQAVSKEEFLDKIKKNEVVDVLNKFYTKRGDIFYLPAGRVHSIGAGNFLVEIQQTSNITYRVYDYDRVDKNGKKRELYTELAKDSIDYGMYDDYHSHLILEQQGEHLIKKCDIFTATLHRLFDEEIMQVSSKGCFTILICIDGSATLVDDAGNVETIRNCETVLLPYKMNSVRIKPSEKTGVEFISVYVENK